MSFFQHRDLYPYIDYYLTHQNHLDMDHLLNEKCLYLHESPKEVVKKLSTAKVLMINPDKFDEWSDILLFIHQKQPLPVKLILIADSDISLDNDYLDALFAFFSETEFWIQNWLGYHERCTLLPLGTFGSIPQISSQKEKVLGISYSKLYIGCKEREDFFAFLKNKPEMLANCFPKSSFDEYCTRLSKCIFHLCPMGEGYDTFRFWESLAVKTIPIVKDHVFYECLARQYPEIPMVRLTEWETVDEYIKEAQVFPELPFLYTDYWVSKIKQFLE